MIYSIISMISIFFIFFMIPETKNKSLHQIAQEIHSVSILTRLFQNLHALPFFNNSQWLEHRAHQYRHQNKPVVKSTSI